MDAPSCSGSEFLQQKLGLLFSVLGQHFPASSICVLQAWLECPVHTSCMELDSCQRQLYSHPSLVLMGNSAFGRFRQQSCRQLLASKLSMPGRVWKTGAVQVVQNVKIIPPSLHPRSQLGEEELSRLAELIYIPVFDLSTPDGGVVAVLEALLSTDATQNMLVADLISCVGVVLGRLQLSLSNPLPQPIRRSALAGRRARPEASSCDSQFSSGDEGVVSCTAGGAGGGASEPRSEDAASSKESWTQVAPIRTVCAGAGPAEARPCSSGASDISTQDAALSPTSGDAAHKRSALAPPASVGGGTTQAAAAYVQRPQPAHKMRRLGSMQRTTSMACLHDGAGAARARVLHPAMATAVAARGGQ